MASDALKSVADSLSLLEARKRYIEAVEVARALRDYIDAIPKNVEFAVAMPGIDRDWVDSVIDVEA
jgi:phage terminase Nu1 subunit (DNA packaging protein)